MKTKNLILSLLIAVTLLLVFPWSALGAEEGEELQEGDVDLEAEEREAEKDHQEQEREADILKKEQHKLEKLEMVVEEASSIPDVVRKQGLLDALKEVETRDTLAVRDGGVGIQVAGKIAEGMLERVLIPSSSSQVFVSEKNLEEILETATDKSFQHWGITGFLSRSMVSFLRIALVGWIVPLLFNKLI